MYTQSQLSVLPAMPGVAHFITGHRTGYELCNAGTRRVRKSSIIVSMEVQDKAHSYKMDSAKHENSLKVTACFFADARG